MTKPITRAPRTYEQIIDANPDAVIIGLTATPCRGDGLGLGNRFDAIVLGPSFEELQDAGRLVGSRIYAPARPDLTGVHVRRGDYVEDELAAAMDKQQLIGDVVQHWIKHGERRRTVLFAVNVAHSVHLRDEFRRAGISAEHIDGTTPAAERAAILARLDAGDIQVVCNCMVLTEGWDQPLCSCIILARPTKSLRMLISGHFHQWGLALSNASQAGMVTHASRLRQLLELRAKINRELAPAQHYGAVTNNILLTGDVTTLMRILQPFPDVRAAIVAHFASQSAPRVIEHAAD